MRLTEEQARAVETKGRVIVSAAAGSGKTAVMIERLVGLVLAGADVREVLAVTFTKKAAAQMRDRLRSALSERLARAEGEERERLRVQLAELPLAEISTIHAFCGRLVRSNFFLADTDAAFRIISPDDAEGQTLKNRALDAVFEEAYAGKDPEFFNLLGVYFRKKKDARLRRILLSLHASMRETAHWREEALCERDGFGEACEYLAQWYRRRAELLSARLDDLGAFFAENNPRALAVAADVVAACNALSGKTLFEMTEIASKPIKIGVMPRMTKATGEELASLKYLSGAGKAIKGIYAELRGFADEETEKHAQADADERRRALFSLVLRFDDVYAVLKRETNVLDYNDLEQLTLKILENEEARRAVRARFTYIFVDEYQDVNRMQERILSLLAGEEVFLVGDSKQAIYGFRGSNSAFFEEKRREFSAFGGDLSLTMNFRSAPAVIDAVSRVFGSLFPSYEPMRPCERFGEHAGGALVHIVPKEKSEPKKLSVYSVTENAGMDAPDPIAERIADVIEEELARGEEEGGGIFDADSGILRKVTFGDIAVLVRKNSGEMDRVVRALNARDIPVCASAKVNVCDFFEVRLLIDWLSYLDNAEQDIPMASAMLSAVGGLDEGELAAVRLRFPSAYAFRTACKLYADKMADPLSQKLKNFFRTAEALRLRAQALPASDILGSLLASGLEAQIAASGSGSMRLSRVRRFLSESEGMSVHAFLAKLKAMGYRLDYAGGGGEDAVQVLTMHASKGLEFPVVILADLDVPFHGADRDDVLFTEQFGAAPAAFGEDRVARETVLRRATVKLQEEEELSGERNLLYVAMTRAKYRLHMIFEGRERAVDPVFADRLSDLVDLTGFADCAAPLTYERAPIARHALAGKGETASVEKLLALYQKPYPYESSVLLPLKSSATGLMREEKSHKSSEKEQGAHGGHSTDEGLAYHAFLEHARFGRPAAEELGRMREEGILSEEQLSLLSVENLQAILALPTMRALEGKRIWREQTFLIELPACEVMETDARDEVLFQGAIDLLTEDEEGFTIVDYKYSARDDDKLRDAYALQIKLYKKAVARAMKVDEATIKARIVNIARLREIGM